MDEPRRGVVWFRVELVPSNLVKDVFRQATDHSKQSNLFHMYCGSCSNRAPHEQDKGLWGVLVEFLKVLEDILMMRLEDRHLRFYQVQSSNSREKNWVCIECLDPKR